MIIEILFALEIVARTLAPVPGEISSTVTQSSIKETICTPGYGESVRPPESYTRRIKSRLLKLAGIPESQRGKYVLDHLIPLEIGGHPSDEQNLWLQPIGEAKIKDQEERHLHKAVCEGAQSLQDAQKMMLRGWRDPKAVQ